jgi:Polyketide cyclase / dehydrase and lipid transport
MAKVNVQVSVRRSIAEVFALISDHEKFLSGVAETTATIVKAGASERNGLGCIREVRVGERIRYVEEITLWQPPYAFEYLISEASMLIRHHGSRLDLVAHEDSTEITWTSRFDIPVPVIGWALGAFLKNRLESAFTAMLLRAKTELEQA